MITPSMKKKVEEIRQNPLTPEEVKNKTDEEIIAASRFVEDGKGLVIYENEEAYRKAKKEKALDEIEEL